MRAAAGLPALTVDGGLSSIANSRCDSFASGGSFDHSGAVCGEIIAAGPFASASSVCAAWQSSPDHYASHRVAQLFQHGNRMLVLQHGSRTVYLLGSNFSVRS